MPLDLKVKLEGADRVEAYLLGVQRQIPFATKNAINDTAWKDIIPAQKVEMRRVFSEGGPPTKYTLGSLFATRATKKDLESRVMVRSAKGSKTPMSETGYIGPHIYGGGRKDKSYERTLRGAGLLPWDRQVVPGRGLQLDKHGNVSGRRIAAILRTLLGVKNVRKTRSRQARGKFEVAEVGKKKTLGVWQIVNGRRRAILLFVRRPRYQKRFNFDRVTAKAFDKNYSKRFDAAFEHAIRTAK